MQKDLATSVADVLDNTPSVSFDGIGRYGLSDITIRGITGNRVKVLVDGEEIADQFSFGPFQNAGRQYMDLNNVKQVEIIKGPASSLQGSDAIDGVVSLVSKDPEDYIKDGNKMGGNVFTTYVGKNNGITIGGAVAGKFSEQFSAALAYTHNKSDELKNHDNNQVDPQKQISHSVDAKFIYQPNANHRLMLSAGAYHYNRDTDVQTSLGPVYGGLYNYSSYTAEDMQKRHHYGIRHDFTINSPIADNGYWRLYRQSQSGQQNTTIGGTMTARGSAVPLHRMRESDYNTHETGIEAQLNKAIVGSIAQNLTYGVSYTHKNVDMHRLGVDNFTIRNNITDEKNAPDSTVDEIGIFAQDRISFGDIAGLPQNAYRTIINILFYLAYLAKPVCILWEVGDSGFTLIPGARYDHYRLTTHPDSIFWKTVGSSYQLTNYNENNLSLRLGALYGLSSTQTLYANYAEGFRAPSFTETNLGFENQRGGYAYVANPNLKPEKSRSIEVGWRSDNGTFSHDLALYYNRYKNFIATQTLTGGKTATGLMEFSSVNLPSAEIYGAELSVDYHTPFVEGLSIGTTVAYAKGKNRTSKEPINTITPLNGNLRVTYDAPSTQWGVSSKLRFASGKKRKDINTDGSISPTAGYGVWDISAYYRPIKDLTLRAGVYNILNKSYLPWSEARNLSDSSRAIYTNPGRWIGASIRYDF